MSTIIKLPQDIINQIAAGEVVERPASIIKELIENSIDAKAGQIEVRINSENENIDLEVIDNGSGMNEENLRLAFQSHTTSKIKSLDDLENIHTFGFRGEALASIASVSKIRIKTKSEESAGGIKTIIEGGKFGEIRSTAANEGTTIIINDIFYNVPARRKFLKTIRTETAHVIQTFIEISLANEGVAFKLFNNDKLVYSFSKDDDLKQRITIISKVSSDSLIPVNLESNVNVHGYIIHPKDSFDRRSDQFIFVNNRPVQDRTIQKAVYEGYRGYIMVNKHPKFYLFIDLPPDRVDVNVHPRKSEVRFIDNNEIFSSVRSAVSRALEMNIKKDQIKTVTNGKSSQYSETPFKNVTPSFDQSHSYKGSYEKAIQNQQILNFSEHNPRQINNQTFVPTDYSQNNDLSGLKSSYQVFNTYIICEKEEELMIIDQHAAAERITFEKLLEQSKKEVVSFLISQNVELKENDKLILLDNLEILQKIGIQMVDSGGNSVIVKTIPDELKETKLEKLLPELAEDFRENKGDRNTAVDIREHILATLSCHTSIRAGMSLDANRIERLINDLLECKNPYSCPHGRPIIWVLSKYEIEKNFKRK